MKEVEGNLMGHELRLCLVASRFNETVVQRLVAGAERALRQHGVAETRCQLVWVPGAMEIPAVLSELAQSGSWDGLVALGAVIRGETPHFDQVARAVTEGVAQLGWRHRLPIGFGVLTVDSVAQAEERSGGKLGNKGFSAALAAIEMASLLRQLRTAPPGGAPGAV